MRELSHPPPDLLCACLQLFLHPRLQALVIGLGGGALPMFLVHHFDTLAVTSVELDPVIAEVCGIVCVT